MLRLAAIAFCGLIVTSCGIARDVMDLAPPLAGRSPVEYQTLASCVELQIAQAGLSKIDRPSEKTSKLVLARGGVRAWEVTFANMPDKSTDWVITGPSIGSRVTTSELIGRAIFACEIDSRKMK